MQAPEVECISKGKEHKKYEFGCKVSVVTTSQRGWVVGMAALHGNPYDGHTLKAAHAQVAKLTGVTPEEIFVDKGYRGAEHHPEDAKVYISGRKLNGTLKRLLRRRSAIEPVIGHLKQDHRMKRKLSARQKWRLRQRAVGGLRLQPKKTHASFLLAHFRLC
jgi:transposase, IS5 family